MMRYVYGRGSTSSSEEEDGIQVQRPASLPHDQFAEPTGQHIHLDIEVSCGEGAIGSAVAYNERPRGSMSVCWGNIV